MNIKVYGYDYGKRAFDAGLKRVFGWDAEAEAWMLSLDREKRIAAMRAWYRGWDDANMAAPIPGWTDEENAAFRRGQIEAQAFRAA